MSGLLLGVETDDPDDLEIGATVWDSTVQDSAGYVGGMIYRINDGTDPATVTVIRRSYASRAPDVYEIPVANIDMGVVTWDTQNAGIHAVNLFRWLGTAPAPKRRQISSEWGAVAVQLQSLKDSGMYLPRAEARYRARKQEQWRNERDDPDQQGAADE